jgi:ATP-binding cassette, subfamily B, bacterial
MKKLLGEEFLRSMSFMKSRIVPYMTGILGMSILSANIFVVESFMLKYLIDASVKKDMSMLTYGLTLIISGAFLIIIFIPIFQYMYNNCARKGHADVRRAVFEHRGKLPISYFEKNHSGSIVSRILNDTEKMSGLYTGRLRRLLFPFIYGSACAVPMFILDWRISIGLVVVNAISMYLNTFFSKPIRSLSKNIQETASTMTEDLLNILSGIQIIKLFHLEETIQKLYTKSNDKNIQYSLKRNKLSAILDSINFFLGSINTLGLLIVGALLVSISFTTFGTLFALLNLQRRLNQAFLDIGANIPFVNDALAGSSRIFEFLDEKPEPETYTMIKDIKSKYFIEMQNVNFGYEKKKNILNDFNLSVSQGETVALVGESGCGKSTIIKLLLGFYPPVSGNITIAGTSLGNMTLKDMRNKIAYVSQDSHIFCGTIKENIMFGNMDATEEEIINAAKAANAHDFIMEQPDGYKTNAGERGERLSGGQKQRIAIARAILKNAPVLLLDEATSALDSESETLVKEALDNLMKSRTTIVISHRLSTVEKSDMICVLNKGNIIEKGTHKELLLLNGEYKSLYEKQFEKK